MSFNPPLLQLPKGVTFDYTATPKFSTILQVPQSGRHPASATLQDSTIFDLELTFSYLSETGFQYLKAFYEAMRGSYGWFLFDPSQNQLANLTLTQDDTQILNGFSGLGTAGNYLPDSQAFSVSSIWLQTQVQSVTDNSTTDPNGGTTGSILAATSSATDCSIRNVDFSVVGTFTFSVWLRLASGTRTIDIFLGEGSESSSTVCNVTSTWQRFTVTHTMTSGTGCFAQIGGGESFAFGSSIYLAWAQVESGTEANPYLKTGSSNIPQQTVFPLWRSSAVFDEETVTLLERIQNVTSFGGLYVNGSLVPSSGYTRSDLPSQVTLSTPPAVGATVAWAGSYNYLVHFSDDTADFDEFSYQLYKLKTLKLTTVNL